MSETREPPAATGEREPSAGAGREPENQPRSAEPARESSGRVEPELAPPKVKPGARPAGKAPRRGDTRQDIQPLVALRNRFRDMVRDAEERAAESERRHVRVPAFLLRVSVQVVRQWARDRCPQQAASLAFQTLLSVVPVIGVAVAFLRATGALEAESKLVDFLSRNLIPVSREEVASKLKDLSANVTFESLGLLGLLVSVLLAFIMFNSLEKVFNSIWRAERQRPLTQKFVVFYASATIGSFLIGTSVYQAAKFGLTQGWTGLAVSFLSTFIAAFGAIMFLPASPVRISPAAIGAAVCTVLFESAKYAFNLYVGEFAFAKYSGVYGALAVAPLLLVWVYYSWIILLLSVEVAYAAQNLHLLERLDRRGRMSVENELVKRVNGVVGARVVVAVVQAYMAGRKVLSRQAIADRFDLSDDVVTRLAERLKRADIIIEVEGDYSGFMPARPPQEITLAEVLGVFRGDDVVVRSSRNDTRLDKVLREIEEEVEGKTRVLAIDELV